MHTPRRRFSEHPVEGGTSKELASLAQMFNTLSKKYKASARTKHFLWYFEYGAEAFFFFLHVHHIALKMRNSWNAIHNAYYSISLIIFNRTSNSWPLAACSGSFGGQSMFMQEPRGIRVKSDRKPPQETPRWIQLHFEKIKAPLFSS